VGTSFAAPLVVQVASAFGEPVAGGRVTFTAPTTGASAVVNPNPATIGADGRASVNAVANGLAGSYVVTAQATDAGSVVIPLTNVAIPTVLAVQRFGDFAFPTTLAVTFSTPLDPTRAQDLGNDQLVELSGPGRPGRTIRLRSAVYDPSSDAVLLKPAGPLPVYGSFVLTVNGTAPGGLRSASGVLLDGIGNGKPGSNFVQRFGQDAVAGPSYVFNRLRYRWAGIGPIGGLQLRAPSVPTLIRVRG
jgi:hypothetical protein